MGRFASQFLFASGIASLIIGGAQSLTPPAKPETWTLLISGDTRGYLAPCGCTKPMSGGIQRRVDAYQRLADSRNTIRIDTGSQVEASTRQNEIKAQSLWESLSAAKIDAVAFTSDDARLGLGGALSATNILGSRVVQGQSKSRTGFISEIAKGPMVITALSVKTSAFAALGDSVDPFLPSVDKFIALSSRLKKVPILLLDGNLSDAKLIAKRFTMPGMIVYRSQGNINPKPEKLGSVWLVSPGEKAKGMLRLSWTGNSLSGYNAVNLGPEFESPPIAKQIYRSYLAQVTEERLLEKLGRAPKEGYVGTDKCISCHVEAGEIWNKSDHAKALRTLEIEGHDKDPDCVGCHVVGLDSVDGFLSKGQTPNLANVGCESCHVGGEAHSAFPYEVKMGKIGAQSCASCHNSEHSPTFNFESYWNKIKH